MKNKKYQKLIKEYREMNDSWVKLCRSINNNWCRTANIDLAIGVLSGIGIGLCITLWVIMLSG